MVPAIEEHADDLKRLCVQHGVKRLHLFGSAANPSRFNPDKSDLDFLVEFQPTAPRTLSAFFGFQRSLEALFGRSVDLVEPGGIRNPYFRESVEKTKVRIYEA